ncbi:hypothetical protein D0868_06994 [Hortaea werneckii]|uniref:ribonuclease H n=1 Tax=Hortaea werneckii TaxID=91943 RepID=A0A3M6YMT7_HORWE|nr:hypothetical protein D0868_06994 [Hortaea werneckii]RMY19575.1 hypothetical protein D0866_12780 [Hortaea werneckii]
MRNAVAFRGLLIVHRYSIFGVRHARSPRIPGRKDRYPALLSSIYQRATASWADRHLLRPPLVTAPRSSTIISFGGYIMVDPAENGHSGAFSVNNGSYTAPQRSPSSAYPSAGPTAPTPAAGAKRKRDGPKFYAVRVGTRPGIYHTWRECLDQVRGYSKAIFKSFPTLAEAEAFMKGENGDTVSGVGNGSGGADDGKPPRFYGVRSGRVPGVYTTWAEVLDNITGWKVPKHKVFRSYEEADSYVKQGQGGKFGDSWAMESIEPYGDDGTAPMNKKSKSAKNGGKKIKDEFVDSHFGDYPEYEPGEAPLGTEVEDGFDDSIILDHSTNGLRYKTGEERTSTKYMAARPVPQAPIRIYTDGSSLSNGRGDSAMAGVGVFFGPMDTRNISEGLEGSKQTNQRAELTAILRALEVAPKDRKVIILSDSNYAIKCTNDWYLNWRRNGWVNASKKPVENRDLIQKVVDILEDRYEMNKHRLAEDGEEDDRVDPDDTAPPGPWEKGSAGVKFVWVKGHSKDEGNSAADRLATAGAREAREMAAEFAGDDEFS